MLDFNFSPIKTNIEKHPQFSGHVFVMTALKGDSTPPSVRGTRLKSCLTHKHYFLSLWKACPFEVKNPLCLTHFWSQFCIHLSWYTGLTASPYKIVKLLYKYLTSLYFKCEGTIVCPCTISIRLRFKSRQTKNITPFFFWFIYVSGLSACTYACMPEEGSRSQCRWLWATTCLLGIQPRTSVRAAKPSLSLCYTNFTL